MKFRTTRNGLSRTNAVKKARGGEARFRRAAPLVLYWQDDDLVFENYALHTRIGAEPLACSILHFCGCWKSLREIVSFLREYDQPSVVNSLRQLCDSGLLEESSQRRDPRLEAMEGWKAWNPAAGFFHFSTKDTEFAPDQRDAAEELKRRARRVPMPLPLKNYPKAQRQRLPRLLSSEEFPRLLKSRRTWRKFSQRAVSLKDLAHALELTFGIQGWANLPGLGRAAMKTAPSGGDLHPIEAYVLAQRVQGLKPGLYHYNAARHELEWLRRGVTRKALERSLGHQPWFTDGAFLVLMTAVFGRTQWKYDFPRAYRVILAEAGHLCQTFCLTATWLGLAPFCTMAQTDTQWEKWLGIDGVTESILYIAGAGTRPRDLQDAHLGADQNPGSAGNPVIS